MKKVIIFLILLVLIIVLFKNNQYPITNIQQIFKSQTSKKIQTIKINDQILQVELARTPKELTQGLGGRKAIGSDGMLFVLPVRQVPYFWMKDTLIPLDFVWIDDARVVGVTSNAAIEPGVIDQNLKIYTPNVPCSHVLELDAGRVSKLGIKVGERINILHDQ